MLDKLRITQKIRQSVEKREMKQQVNVICHPEQLPGQHVGWPLRVPTGLDLVVQAVPASLAVRLRSSLDVYLTRQKTPSGVSACLLRVCSKQSGSGRPGFPEIAMIEYISQRSILTNIGIINSYLATI